jgi:hypothetical protein
MINELGAKALLSEPFPNPAFESRKMLSSWFKRDADGEIPKIRFSLPSIFLYSSKAAIFSSLL